MTTATLLAKPSVRLAYCLEIEGTGIVWTDTDDTAGIRTARGGGVTVKTGLRVPGTISRSIDLLGFTIQPVSLSFEIDDHDGTLCTLMASALTTAKTTYLTANVDRDDTTINVKATAAFDASGTIYLGHERITYSGKTGTSFTGCTRGVFGTFKTAWSHTHRGTTTDGIGAEVSSAIRIWPNRGVLFYVVALDPATDTWCPYDSGAGWTLDFAGTIDDWKQGGNADEDGRLWVLDCVSLEQGMSNQMLRDQFIGTIEGFTIPAGTVYATEFASDPAVDRVAAIAYAAGHYTLDSWIQTLNAGLAAAYNAAPSATQLGFYWGLELVASNGKWRVRLTVHNTGVTGSWTYSLASVDAKEVLEVLGVDAATGIFSVGASLVTSPTPKTATGMTPNTPIVTIWNPYGTTLDLTNTGAIRGTWANQTADELPSSYPTAEGFIQVGDNTDVIWLVSESSGVLTRLASWTYAGHQNFVSTSDNFRQVIYYGDDGKIPVKQVWLSQGRLSKLLLRMLLSTGTVDYNTDGGTSYDKWPATMGLGIPSSLVDIASIQAIDVRFGGLTVQYLALTEPESALDHIQSLMATYGFYLVWRNGKLTATFPATITAMPADWALTSSNTGSEHYSTTASGKGQIANQITLKYNRDPVTGDYNGTDTFDNLPSQYEYGGPPASFEYEARSLRDEGALARIAAWRTNVAANFVAFFGRALRRVTRSANHTLVGLSVGDVVTITDDDAPSATVGTYGLSVVKAWVTDYTWDYDACEFTSITLLMTTGRAYPWAPSGMLDYSRGDKGYDAGNVRLYLRANEFSNTSDSPTTDVASFLQDDYIRIVEVDPADPAAPTTWIRQIGNVPATDAYITLTAALSAPAWDATKRYYVELDDYNSTAAGGTAPVAFIGDDTTDTVQTSYGTFLWADGPVTQEATTPVATNRWRLPANVCDDDGEPLSVAWFRDLGDAVNNLYAYVTNKHPVDDCFITERSVGVTTYGYLYHVKVYCPFGATSLLFRAFVRSSGAAGFGGNIRVTATPTLPTGTVAAPVYGVDVSQVTSSNVASTTLAAVDLTVALNPDAEGNCYIVVEGQGKNTNDLIYLRGVTASFAARDVTV